MKLNPIEVDPVVAVPNDPNEPKENNGDVLVESSPKDSRIDMISLYVHRKEV